MEFKILTFKKGYGQIITAHGKKGLYWQNPQGRPGNVFAKFNNRVMIVRPHFSINTIKVYANIPRDYSLYISGQGNYLGNWKHARKLTKVGKREWHITSWKMWNGFRFKIIAYKNGRGHRIQTAGKSNLYWQDPPGGAGDKIMKFDYWIMNVRPRFSIHRGSLGGLQSPRPSKKACPTLLPNTIKVFAYIPKGYTLYISGLGNFLGNWGGRAQKLRKVRSGEWHFTSRRICNGMEFKILTFKKGYGQIITAHGKKGLYWQNPQGRPGNVFAKFNNRVMIVRPHFSINTIKVYANIPRDYSLYISGQGNYLGNWKHARKLTKVGKREWHITSWKMWNGFRFKIIAYKNGRGHRIQTAGKSNLYWQDPPGGAGDKIMKFDYWIMNVRPRFSIHRGSLGGVQSCTKRTLVVYYNTGYGRALYISGLPYSLGNWNTAFKLRNIGPSEWHYTACLHDGMRFKIIRWKWTNGDRINVKGKRSLVWENPQTWRGDKFMKFFNNRMTHRPNFPNRY